MVTSPPSSTQDSRTAVSKLPAVLTSFVGRERELAEVTHWLASTRLLTLIGVGGCGKTRLALELALRQAAVLEDAVCWVDLASFSEPARVIHAAAQALGLREAPNESLLETIGNYLEKNSYLFVLDNCEHLLAPVRELVEALLIACPSLKVLATSREPLAVGSEVTWLVPALALPADPRLSSQGPHDLPEIEHSDAVRLFIERAQSVLTTFTLTPQNQMAVAQICRRLDGMPLAIELAAARINVLAVQQIADRLDDRFALLTGGNRTALIPRHQTLRATLDWSYDLLSEPERILFRRLSVFAGGFNLEAAEAIGAGNGLQPNEILDLLSHLIDKSLVAADTQGRSEARYRLLETVRQYALERLTDSSEIVSARQRHLDHFAALAHSVEGEARDAAQVIWFDRLETDHDNLRAALAWSLEAENAVDQGLRLAAGLAGFWFVRGHWSEGIEWQRKLIEKTAGGNTLMRATVLRGACLLVRLQGDFQRARRLAEESLAICRQLEDARGTADSLFNLGIVLTKIELAAAQPLLEESLALFRELGDRPGMAGVLGDLGVAAEYQNDPARARTYFEQSLTLRRELADTWGVAFNLYWLGELALEQYHYAEAQSFFEEGLVLRRAIGDKEGIADVCFCLGEIALARNDLAAARALATESLTLYQQLGERRGQGDTLMLLGEVAQNAGDPNQAEVLYIQSLTQHRQTSFMTGGANVRLKLGALAYQQKDFARAGQLFQDSLVMFLGQRDQLGVARSLTSLAAIASALGQPKLAAMLLGQAQALLEAIGQRLDPVESADSDQTRAMARRQLGEIVFTAAWTEGQAQNMWQISDKAREIKYGKAPDLQPFALIEPLNEREREMLQLIADGLSNHEIAERSVIALSTVKWHIGNLFGKLGVNSRTQAIVRAKEIGLL